MLFQHLDVDSAPDSQLYKVLELRLSANKLVMDYGHRKRHGQDDNTKYPFFLFTTTVSVTFYEFLPQESVRLSSKIAKGDLLPVRHSLFGIFCIWKSENVTHI